MSISSSSGRTPSRGKIRKDVAHGCVQRVRRATNHSSPATPDIFVAGCACMVESGKLDSFRKVCLKAENVGWRVGLLVGWLLGWLFG